MTFFWQSNGGLIKSASGGGTKSKHVCDIKTFLNGNKDCWNRCGVRGTPIQTD